MMTIFKVPRTGDRTLQFEGEQLAKVSSRHHQGPCQTRWYELALYRTAAKKYVVTIGYRTQWQGELLRDEAFVEDTAPGVAEILRSTVPDLPLHGFPPGERFDAKRAHVGGSISACFEQAVSELLNVIEPEII